MRAALVSLLLGSLFVHSAAGAPGSKAAAMDAAGRFDFRKIVSDAKDKVFPAVVFLKVRKESHATGKKVTQEVLGSGVLISKTGELLTNWHVIDKAVEVRCLLYDGRGLSAKVLGSDKDTDLALVQLELPKGGKPVPVAELGDSRNLEEGDFVMAMGAPYGLSRSVSIGIISCTRRFLKGASQYSLWLQTDAAINPGNSGGPLVNTQGKVIGINTRGASGGGGLGFSVPAETIRLIVERLRAHGKVSWAWTGLQLQPLKDFNRNIYFEGTDGVIVAETHQGSPARRAGLKVRDRVLRINGKPVSAEREEDLPRVHRMLALLAKDKPARFEVRRDGKVIAVNVTPREKGKVQGDDLELPRWDLTVKTINQFENEDLYFYRKEGVFVYGVKYPGNASKAGLASQDIILKIGGKVVKTLDDVKKIHAEAVQNVQKEHRILLTLLRNGLMQQLILDFSRDYEKE